MRKLIVGRRQWLYPIGHPVRLIVRAARLLMHRDGVSRAKIVGYCCEADTLYITL